MSNVNFVILYVADVAKSGAFYESVLGRPALESSPGFAMFEAGPALRLGLWRADEVEPTANAPGGAELAIAVRSDADVDAAAAAWRDKGVHIVLAPMKMDFGYTFVGVDLDGHRLRVFAPGG
jgi:predicted enzyme related to lactoylglutathione lyase